MSRVSVVLAVLLLACTCAAPALGAPVTGASRDGYAKSRPSDGAAQQRRDDAEQRGHVIPDEDSSPRTPDPAPAPGTPAVSASPVRAASPVPVAAPHDELPRTGGDDGLLLLWFGALVGGAGLCLRRAIA
jgi:LPXTG-motif cell wall-anchored protein